MSATLHALPVRIEMLAIGDEILDGRVTDTNTRDLGDWLSQRGFRLMRATKLPDDMEIIVEEIKAACARADIVVTTGGLGPTADDLTSEAIAKAAGVGMRFDDEALKRMEERFASFGMHMTPNNRKQAEVPATARALYNEKGTAPGICTPVGQAQIWSFPGVPREFSWLFATYLAPILDEKRQSLGGTALAASTIRTLGIAESALDAALVDFEKANSDVRVQYRTLAPENHVRLVVAGDTEKAAAEKAQKLAEDVKSILGPVAYAIGDADVAQLCMQLLQAQQKQLALVDTASGGVLGALFAGAIKTSTKPTPLAWAWHAEATGTANPAHINVVELAEQQDVSLQTAAQIVALDDHPTGKSKEILQLTCTFREKNRVIWERSRFLPLAWGEKRLQHMCAAWSARLLLATLRGENLDDVESAWQLGKR